MTADTSSNGLPMPKIERTRPVMMGSPKNAVGAQEERSRNEEKLQHMHCGDAIAVLVAGYIPTFDHDVDCGLKNVESTQPFKVRCLVSNAVLLVIPGKVGEQS